METKNNNNSHKNMQMAANNRKLKDYGITLCFGYYDFKKFKQKKNMTESYNHPVMTSKRSSKSKQGRKSTQFKLKDSPFEKKYFKSRQNNEILKIEWIQHWSFETMLIEHQRKFRTERYFDLHFLSYSQ